MPVKVKYRFAILCALVPYLVLAMPLAADALLLEKPIVCELGVDCFIQNYVDAEPGPGYADDYCGSLSYDKHKGVDFRVPFTMMQEGVEVEAAAPGIVRGVRDGMEDVSIRRGGVESIKNRECGNGVLISHAEGVETQYCHMRKGSIRVKAGEKVATGQPLGLVGLSGDTEFPHLHFEVRVHGKTVSPFTGRDMESGCSAQEGKTLWSEKALKSMPYIPTGALDAGFSIKQPDINTVFVGGKKKVVFSPQSPQVLFWAGFWGAQKGDSITMRIDTPTGEIWTAPEQIVPRNQAQILVTMGKKRTVPWPPGTYKGKVALVRPGANGKKSIVLPMARSMVIPPPGDTPSSEQTTNPTP